MSRIICGLPGPAGAWKRAGQYSGIDNVVEVDPKRPLDVLAKTKPSDRIFLDKSYQKYDVKDAKIVEVLPAVDTVPNSSIGDYQEKYACKLAIVNTPEIKAIDSINYLYQNYIPFKVFGHYSYGVPEYIGIVDPKELPSVYYSAYEVLDLAGDIYTIMAIGAAGGTCLSVANYCYPEIAFLNPTRCNYLAPYRYSHENAGDLTKKHTFAHRLQELVYGENQRPN